MNATLRMDSDVPVPSGRTLPLTSAENKRRRKAKAKAKAKTKLAAIMVSNCGGRNKRWEYVKELRKHMPVDVYGACGNLRYVRSWSDLAENRVQLLLTFVNTVMNFLEAEQGLGIS